VLFERYYTNKYGDTVVVIRKLTVVQHTRSSWCNRLGAVPCKQFGEEHASPVHIVMWTIQRNFVHVERFYYTDVPCVTFPVSAHGVCHCVTDCSDGGYCTVFGTKL
jgi:hypothetical protein